ncbi:hypothetical protein ACWGB8_17600 [Kitasatospora sp. NPDC054939]
MKEKVGEGAAATGRQASEVADTAQEQAAHVAGEALSQARDLATGLREEVREQSRTQTRRLAHNVHGLARELQQMGEHGEPHSPATTAVRRLAEGGQRIADHLEQRGPEGLLDDVQDFARRRPALFLAGAALAGFALGRTGKGVSAASDTNGAPSPAEAAGPKSTPPAGASPRHSTHAAPRTPVTREASAADAVTDPYNEYGQSQPPHMTPEYAQERTPAPPASGPTGRAGPGR